MTKEDGVGHSNVDVSSDDATRLKGDLVSKISEVNSLKAAKGSVHFKILVPSIAAGAIIGKGGEAITEIQNQTSAKVKMSKANAFYPERVCLIVGTIDSILRVFQYISEKIYEKPESIPRTGCEGRLPTERHKQVKILVPNSTAGMIIGKGGSFIKELKDTTGVFIQVSQKSKELNLAERCVTVAGELSQTREAIALILSKIAEDPQSSSCPNISYSEIIGPVASAYPTGSPYALSVGSHPGLPVCGMNFSSDVHFRTVSSSNSTFTSAHINSLSPVSPTTSNPTSVSMFSGNPSPNVAAAMAAMNAVVGCPPNATRSSSSTLMTNGGRALMGRGVASTHHQSIPHSPHSLLGSVAAHYGAKLSPTYTNTTGCVMSSPNSNGSLEGIRNVLRSAGYSDIATEEIANAMDVLSLYGFISMSSLTGCINTSSIVNPSSNNHHPHHLTMNSNAFSGLSRSFSNYEPNGASIGGGGGGHQSPIFSNHFYSNDLPLNNSRNLGTVSLQNCTTTTTSSSSSSGSSSTQPSNHQMYMHRRSSFSSSSSSYQPHINNLNSHSRGTHLPIATTCGGGGGDNNNNHITTNNIEVIPILIQDMKVPNPSDTIICNSLILNDDSHKLDVPTGLYSSLSSNERLDSKTSTQSTVVGIHTVSSSIANMSIHKRNGITVENSVNTGLILHRLSDGNIDEESVDQNSITCCPTVSIINDTSRTNSLWNL
ncbi:unnamed protein product [Heterobilharzia americana]|nr:unnamed protein product [Heterobilharzia americana]